MIDSEAFNQQFHCREVCQHNRSTIINWSDCKNTAPTVNYELNISPPNHSITNEGRGDAAEKTAEDTREEPRMMALSICACMFIFNSGRMIAAMTLITDAATEEERGKFLVIRSSLSN
jgi:hypothetical protein